MQICRMLASSQLLNIMRLSGAAFIRLWSVVCFSEPSVNDKLPSGNDSPFNIKDAVILKYQQDLQLLFTHQQHLCLLKLIY